MISVIIRTRNEGKTLPDVLQKIKAQEYGGEVEVIVVDSGSKDNTLISAKEAGCKVIEVQEKDFSFGRAINEGVKNARGDFIVLLSGHTLPVDEKWLGELLKEFAPNVRVQRRSPSQRERTGFTDSTVAAVFGRQVPIKGYDPFEEWQFYRNFPKKISRIRNLALGGDAFSNASCAIRRDVLIKYPFDETLPGSEDREWAGRMKKRGFKVKYAPESRVFHSHPMSYRAIYERKFIQAKARKMVYPDSSMYDKILWLAGAIIATILIDAAYCLLRGYFKFLPKIFPYRYWYFKGIIAGTKDAKKLAT